MFLFLFHVYRFWYFLAVRRPFVFRLWLMCFCIIMLFFVSVLLSFFLFVCLYLLMCSFLLFSSCSYLCVPCIFVRMSVLSLPMGIRCYFCRSFCLIFLSEDNLILLSFSFVVLQAFLFFIKLSSDILRLSFIQPPPTSLSPKG